jgi:hypothetical protein
MVIPINNPYLKRIFSKNKSLNFKIITYKPILISCLFLVFIALLKSSSTFSGIFLKISTNIIIIIVKTKERIVLGNSFAKATKKPP